MEITALDSRAALLVMLLNIVIMTQVMTNLPFSFQNMDAWHLKV